jgi:hypothetical protein
VLNLSLSVLANAHILFLITAYLVVADEAYGRQIPFAFLERVRDEFEEKFSEKGQTAAAHSLDRSFG